MEKRHSPHSIVRARSLDDLRARIEAVDHHRVGRAASSIVTGWGRPIESLACGVLHEWFSPPARRGQTWTAPILMLAHLARQSMRDAEAHRIANAGMWIICIGRRMWPQPHALIAPGNDQTALGRSLLVDPASPADRLWTIDLCLRSPAVAAVLADAGGLNLAHSRRLQLAAESGNALSLLARPAEDLATPSAAVTRWRVQRMVSPTARPRWRLELVRCKGLQRWRGMDADPVIVLEHHHATGCVRVPAPLADRPTQAAAPPAPASAIMRRAG